MTDAGSFGAGMDDDAASATDGVAPSGAGPDNGGPSGAGPDSGGPSGAGPDSGGPSGAGPDSGGPSGAGPDSGGPSGAGPDSGGPSGAGPDSGGRDSDTKSSDAQSSDKPGGEPSDPELITRVRGGDRAAYGTLYARHATAATTLARQFARSAAEVDDLVSEAFARVLDLLLAGRGPDTAFRAYLFTTLRHTAFDRTRKDARLQFTDDIAAHDAPEIPDDPVVRQLESSLVARAFTSLPERWQTVLWHTQVEGETPEQVGVLLGITPNAVTSLSFRAREGLRQAYLQAHLADTAAERCRATVGRLGSWARGGLAKREKAQVDAHLAECERCRALAAELTEMNTSLRALLAPLLLGGAALGYLGAAPAAAAGMAAMGSASASSAVSGQAMAGGASAGSAAAGSASASGAASGGALAHAGWWSSWPVLAASGAGLVVAAVAGIIVINNGTSPTDDATPPPAPTAAQHPGPAVVDQSTTSPWVTTASPLATSAPPETGPTQTTAPTETTAPASTPTTPAPVSTAGAPIPGTPAPGAKITAKPTKTSPTTKTTTKEPVATSTSPTALPAALTAPQITGGSISAAAGSTASLSFTVTNSGGVDSAVQQLAIAAPAGIAVAGGSVVTGPGVRGAHQAAIGLRVADPGLSCTASACSYLVPAATTLTVTLNLAVGPTAQSGTLTLTTAAGSAAVDIAVQPGATAVVLGAADTLFFAGGVVDFAPLTAYLAPGVTTIPPVTFPRTAGALQFTPIDPSCTGTRTTITCTATKISGEVAYWGAVRVVIAANGSGPQQVTADIGGRAVPILAASGAPITVLPPFIIGPNG